MLSIAALIATVIGWLLIYFTEMTTFPFILIGAGVIVAVVDIVKEYMSDKQPIGDFIKHLIRNNWGIFLAIISLIEIIWIAI